MKLPQLSVSQLLWSATALVLVSLAGIGFLAHGATQAVVAAMNEVEAMTDVERDLAQLGTEAEEAEAAHLRFIFAGEPGSRETFERNRGELLALLDSLKGQVTEPEQVQRLGNLEQALVGFLDGRAVSNELRATGRVEEARAASVASALAAPTDLIAEMSQAQAAIVEDLESATDAQGELSTWLQVGAIALVGVLLVSVNGLVSRRMKVAFAERAQAEQRSVELAEREAEQAADLRARIAALLVVVQAAEQGDLTRPIDADGEDALAALGTALGAFLAQLRANVATIDENAGSLAEASARMLRFSEDMGANAEETSRQAATVAAASQQVSSNVTTVAAATEEMSSSIREISRTCNTALGVAMNAVDAAASTGERVTALGDSSNEIGQIIQMIGTIARQTNLLALNATIEAARAGDAGKGFAVVANEVKDLADRTAQASQEVTDRIESIQGDTTSVVEAIGRIGAVIGEINELQSTIAAAVEEQSAVSAEMGQSTTHAAEGCTEISTTITTVADSAQQTSAVTSSSAAAAGELADMAGNLKALVRRFTY